MPLRVHRLHNPPPGCCWMGGVQQHPYPRKRLPSIAAQQLQLYITLFCTQKQIDTRAASTALQQLPPSFTQYVRYPSLPHQQHPTPQEADVRTKQHKAATAVHACAAARCAQHTSWPALLLHSQHLYCTVHSLAACHKSPRDAQHTL